MRIWLLASALILIPYGSRAITVSSPKADAVPAKAEVSAVKPPVKLTLSVYKTELKLQDDFKLVPDFDKLHREHPGNDEQIDWGNVDAHRYLRKVPIKVGEPLWIRIRLTNVGKKPMFVMDDLFTGPDDFQKTLEAGRYGVSVVITGPDGNKVPWQSTKEIFGMQCPENDPTSSEYRPTPQPGQNPKEKVQIEAWRKEGKSTREIYKLLNEQEAARRRREQTESKHPIARLEPGETISTRPWRYSGKCKKDNARLPHQVGDFAELWNFHLDSPGTYKIRAIYSDDPYRRSGGKPIEFKTPPIKITVLP